MTPNNTLKVAFSFCALSILVPIAFAIGLAWTVVSIAGLVVAGIVALAGYAGFCAWELLRDWRRHRGLMADVVGILLLSALFVLLLIIT